MQSRLRMFLLASLMATLTAVGAVIRVPMFPVPITLQTFFVLLAGGLLGANWGGISMLIYLTLGLIGLPVFAGGSGIGIILSPTFGYLLAFPFAAYFVGKKFENVKNDPAPSKRGTKDFFHLILGLVIIYVFGVFYLWIIKNLYVGDKFPVSQAILVGFVFFIPGLLLKALLAYWVIFRLRSQLSLFLIA